LSAARRAHGLKQCLHRRCREALGAGFVTASARIAPALQQGDGVADLEFDDGAAGRLEDRPVATFAGRERLGYPLRLARDRSAAARCRLERGVVPRVFVARRGHGGGGPSSAGDRVVAWLFIFF
jgi:hypothetical protein